MKKNKKNKPKWKNIIVIFIFLIALIVFVIASIKLINHYFDSKEINEEVNKLNEITKIDNVKNGQAVNKENASKNEPYWDYIKMDLMDVDLTSLKKINDDTVGWIKVNKTNVNYPVVQTNDNSYYLTHSFYKEYNMAGWVFADYRSDFNNLDKNTIIYAHGMNNGTMFGSLRKILDSDWYNDINNHIVNLSTDKENTLWQVFSIYHIKTTNDYLKVNFNNNKDFNNFINMLKKRSDVKFDASVDENDKILTLSTCYNKSEKVVLHAKLIKKGRK